MADKVRWQVLECDRVLYVDRGHNTILCDRLPSPVTLVVKLRSQKPGVRVNG